MDVYSADEKVYKKFGFAKAVLISEVGHATKDKELKCNKATTLNKKQSTIMERAELMKQCIEKFRLSNQV